MARSRTGKPSMKGKTAQMLADGQQRAVLTLFALAWRVFGFQRKQIIALSQSDPPGPMANKRGLSAELEALEQVRAEGKFAVLHDLTICLRIGDITVFDEDGARRLTRHAKVTCAARTLGCAGAIARHPRHDYSARPQTWPRWQRSG